LIATEPDALDKLHSELSGKDHKPKALTNERIDGWNAEWMRKTMKINGGLQ
jgi:hypothetical protein